MLFHIYDLFSHVVEISVDHLLSFDPELTKFKYTCEMFNLDFLENEASHDKLLIQIFLLFLHVKSHLVLRCTTISVLSSILM